MRIFSLSILFLSFISYGMEQDMVDTAHSLARENQSLLSLIPSGWSYGISADNAERILKQLSKEKYFPYQDILVNNETLWHGVGSDCPSRYKALKNELSKHYKRPITVLDIGANNGYFSLKLANDMDAQCVMADMTDRLKDICHLNSDINNKLIYLKKQLSTQDLQELKKKFHFDVAIALHVLHHIPDWKDFSDNLFELADTVVIETPPANDPRLEKKSTIPAIESYLKDKNGMVIAKTPRTVPGYFDDLKEMTYSVVYTAPIVKDVKSDMYYFNPAASSQTFNKIDTDALTSFNRVFPQ